MKLLSKIFKVENGELLYDWDYIETIEEFKVLKDCQQSPKWHSEGNAWVHTKLVCEAMVKRLNIMDETYDVNPFFVKTMMAAALFHDIGKSTTTKFVKDNWHSYGHEMESERITRLLLWDEGYDIREEICSLVRWHMEPLNIFTHKNPVTEILKLSKLANLRKLLLLKTCDVDGSIQQDKKGQTLDYRKLVNIRDIARGLSCFYSSTSLPLGRKYDWEKNEVESNLFIMIGLPGAGKDTFINKVATIDRNYTIVCRDDIRVELGYCTADEKIVGTPEQEAEVSRIFDERLVKAAEEGKDIIVNGINLKKKYRVDIAEKVKKFGMNIVYVYIEAPSLQTNIDRRKGQIKEEVFTNMIKNFEWPTYEEYDSFSKHKNNEN